MIAAERHKNHRVNVIPNLQFYNRLHLLKILENQKLISNDHSERIKPSFNKQNKSNYFSFLLNHLRASDLMATSAEA